MRAPLLAIALTAAAVGACQLTVEFDRSRIEGEGEGESFSDAGDAGARTDGRRGDGGDGGDGGDAEAAKPSADASTPDAALDDAG